MAGILDFIKRPRFDHPDRKAALANRSQVYNLLDNIIGFEDDRVTPGEALGTQARTDPIGLLGSVVQGVGGDLRNLMFEGGARQRPQDVLGYAAAPMAPGAMSGRVANVLSSGGARPKSITAYHGGTGSVADAAGGRGAWFSEAKDLADEYAFGGGSVNQFSISPQRPIEFLHAEQRRPIGDLISTAVENAGDLSDDTISAARGKISALQKRYGDEKRPLFEYWNNDPDIADLFRTLGYDSISVAEKSGGPQTWAALTPDIISPTPPPSPAQEVAGLLSSGRADEVTDEMLAKFTPKDEMEIFDLYQRGATGMDLPMDEASRMARAKEAGSDTGVPLYRGDQQSMRQSFDTGTGARANIGVTSSTSPNVAATYMTGDNPAMFPLFARSENELSLDAQGRTWRGIPADARANTSRLDDILDVQGYLDDDNLFDYNAPAVDWGDGSSTNMAITDTNSVSRAAQEAGFDQVRFRNIVDRGGAGRFHTGPANDPHTTVMTADPSNIRSRFARFDPRLAHLRNLSAGVGGLGLLSTMLPQEDQY